MLVYVSYTGQGAAGQASDPQHLTGGLTAFQEPVFILFPTAYPAWRLGCSTAADASCRLCALLPLREPHDEHCEALTRTDCAAQREPGVPAGASTPTPASSGWRNSWPPRRREAGLDVEFQAVAPGRSNLLARLSPRGKVRQRLLLAPHLDTVNAADEQFTPRNTERASVWPRRLRHQRFGGGHARRRCANWRKAGSGRRRPRSSSSGWWMRSTARRGRAPWWPAGSGRPGDCGRADALAGGDGAQGHVVAGAGDAGQVGAWLLPGIGAQRGARHGPRC